MAYLSKGRSVAVVEEVSYGAATPTFTNVDYIDYTGSDLSTSIENLERNVVRNSMLALAPLLGQETSSGSITVEVSGDNAVTGVNGHLLYKNGIGKFINNTVATTATGGTTSTIIVTSAVGYAVGQIVKINLGTGDSYTTITEIAGSTLTVAPILSEVPTTGDAIVGLATYILPKPNDTVPSLAVRENLKPTTGNAIDYDYLGVVVSDVALSYPVGNIATAQFTVAGASFTATTPGTIPALPCTIATPVVGKNATLTVLGTNYAAQDLSINVTTEITDVNAMTTDGLSNKLAVGKGVTGSFKVEYTGVASFDAFKAGTIGELMLQVRDGGKTAPMLQVVYMPSIKFTEVSRSEDGSLLYDTITFQAMSPDCLQTERALSIAFA